MTKCEHEWVWFYDCFEDSKIIEPDVLGIPVRCPQCSARGIEWWNYKETEEVREDAKEN